MTTAEDAKKAAQEALAKFEEAAKDLKAKLLAAGGQTKEKVSADTRSVMGRIDSAVSWTKAHLGL